MKLYKREKVTYKGHIEDQALLRSHTLCSALKDKTNICFLISNAYKLQLDGKY